MVFIARVLILVNFTLLFATLASGACTGTQYYVLAVRISFTPNALGTVPRKGNIPVIVVVAHNSSFKLFKSGERMGDIVAGIARTGVTDALGRELDRLVGEDLVSSYTFFPDPGVNSTTLLQVFVRDNVSYVSLLVPLSPSPAWFSGIDSYNLCNSEGKFVTEKADIPANNFDSGLDRGNSFNADPDPYGKDENVPVGPEGSIGDGIHFVRLSVKQGKLPEVISSNEPSLSTPVRWWMILIGALAGTAIVFLLVLIPIRFRRRGFDNISLEAQDGEAPKAKTRAFRRR